MSVTDNLKRGVTELVILSLLSQRDMYGYELSQELRERSGGRFVLLETSMYPALYRMQDNGYISSVETLVGRRRKRTYYHLEPPGRQYLQQGLEEYWTVQKGVQGIFESCSTEQEGETNESK